MNALLISIAMLGWEYASRQDHTYLVHQVEIMSVQVTSNVTIEKLYAFPKGEYDAGSTMIVLQILNVLERVYVYPPEESYVSIMETALVVDYVTKSLENVFYQQDVNETETARSTNTIVMKTINAVHLVSKNPIADQMKNVPVISDVL